MILLIAALGVGLGQERLLCQKCLYVPADALHPFGVALAARIPQAGQKGVHRLIRPTLQNVVDRPYRLIVVRGVVVLRPHIFQQFGGLDADLAAPFDFPMLVYAVRLLNGAGNVSHGEIYFRHRMKRYLPFPQGGALAFGVCACALSVLNACGRAAFSASASRP